MLGLEPHQIENIIVTFMAGVLVGILAMLGFGGWSFCGLFLMLVTAIRQR